MSANELLVSAASGAMIVICGGLYALLLALGRLRGRIVYTRAAGVAYGALMIFVFILADALALTRGWLIVAGVMLAGYWLAPKAIWYLTQATHRESNSSGAER